jgi:hypothetical protein
MTKDNAGLRDLTSEPTVSAPPSTPAEIAAFLGIRADQVGERISCGCCRGLPDDRCSCHMHGDRGARTCRRHAANVDGGQDK